ncbi:hypothetical protein [Brevundimonas sp.]|uniref:hypothetical protein n=1 Tax=Brevundimonas sp. TaxID=1871086 RepID=UPI003D0F1D3F
MAYKIVSNGVALDARIEIEGTDIRLYSRSGRTGSAAARNVDYSPGLRALLTQLRAAQIAVTEGFVDSGRVQTLPLEDRRILSPKDIGASPDEQFRLLSQRMRRVGRTDDSPGGNNNKLIRLRTSANTRELLLALDLAPTSTDARSLNRIPDIQLAAVRPHHIWTAIEALRTLTSWSPYYPSIDYDVLLDDGVRLPPKAVFGRAASLALGLEVLPRHFSGGLGTVCFAALEEAGFVIVAKNGLTPASNPAASEEDAWAEGTPKLGSHMRRERARGLSRAKKSAFMAANDGRLFCEQCLLEPAVAFNDPLADACIEAHHREVVVASMAEGHVTKLEDLECLCANCHRLVHARLRAAEKAALVTTAPA